MNWKTSLRLIYDSFSQALADNVPLLTAGIAFYSLVSLAPLIVVAVAVAGLVFGHEAAQGEVFEQLRALMGAEGAQAVQGMILRSSETGRGAVATALGVLVLLFGASRLFAALRITLNTIWGVQARSDWGMTGMVRDRLSAFLMVLGTGFLLLVSLLLSAALAAITKYFTALLPGANLLWRLLDLLLNFGLTWLIFGLILQVVPDVRLAWRDVILGALLTSLLFGLGRYLIGLYLGQGSFASVYGAAGSLVILLFWIYYSAQILCLGAEFTKLYARRRGARVELSPRVVYERQQSDRE